MSLVLDGFQDGAKWQQHIVGTGTVSDLTQESFKATVNVSGDIAGLVTVNAYDLSESDLRVMADMPCGKTGLVVSPSLLADPLGKYNYGISRDRGYGVVVWVGGGADYIAPDSVPPEQTAELRIAISGGVISFYYNETLVYSAPVSPSIGTTLYVYLVSYATYAGTEVAPGTSMFASTAYVPPLEITVDPPNAFLVVGQSIIFTAAASGGYPPHTINWIDNITKAIIATGETYTFNAVNTGNFEIYAQVIDSTEVTATSPIIPIAVSPRKHTLMTESTPIPGVTFAINRRS